MSGLDTETCRILEVAAIVTDLNLNELDTDTFHQIIHQPQAVLDAMDTWCTEHHGKSGLTEAVKSGCREDIVAADLRKLIDEHWSPGQQAVLCGNTIGTDRRFIDKYWPNVAERLHYRMLDVSSWKLIFQYRYGIHVPKNKGHRALDDVRESIEELRRYIDHIQIDDQIDD
jgi:oligoribonuclease